MHPAELAATNIAFSINLVIQFLLRELHWIRLIGGSLLIGIGIYYYRKQPHPLSAQHRSSAHSEFLTAFLLNLTNPTVVLSFLAILAALTLDGKIRLAVWIFLGGLALRTVIHMKAQE